MNFTKSESPSAAVGPVGGNLLRRLSRLLLLLVLLASPLFGKLLGDSLEHWNLRASTNAFFSDAAYGNGKFFVVGSWSDLPNIDFLSVDGLSSDGISWEIVIGSSPVACIAYGKGVFVAGFDDGLPSGYISTFDGTRWVCSTNFFTAGSGAGVFKICYAGGQFFALTQNTRTNATSTDGITWIPRRQSYPLVSVSFAGTTNTGGYYVGFGSSATFERYTVAQAQQVLISSDGLSWGLAGGGSMPFVDTYVAEVVYGNGVFVAVGKDPATQSGEILAARDGRSLNHWVRVSTWTNALSCVRYLGGLFFAGDALGRVLTSPDGTNWTYRPTIPSAKLALGAGSLVAPAGGAIYESAISGFQITAPQTLQLTGAVGFRYRVEHQDSFAAGTEWIPGSTFTLTNSPFTWSDPLPGNGPSRFYRLSIQP